MIQLLVIQLINIENNFSIFVHSVRSDLTFTLNLEGCTLSEHIPGMTSIGLDACTVRGHSLLKMIVNILVDLHFLKLMTERALLITSFLSGHCTGLT